MRRGNDSDFVMNNKQMAAVLLGSDFTTEHEWGIADIKSAFGIPSGEKDWGIVRRKITRVPDMLTFGWTTGYAGKGEGFYLEDPWDDKKPDFSSNYEISPREQTLACAWDGGSFGVFSTSNEQIGYLHEIYDAFLNLDGAIFMGGGGPWKNSGLVLAIASRIPQKFLDEWYAFDKDHYDLNQEVEATGIHELLAKKDKRYFSLRPRRQSDGSISYWLNPQHQRENNCGWFTLEDLKEWAEDKGKIPMNPGGKR